MGRFANPQHFGFREQDSVWTQKKKKKKALRLQMQRQAAGNCLEGTERSEASATFSKRTINAWELFFATIAFPFPSYKPRPLHFHPFYIRQIYIF